MTLQNSPNCSNLLRSRLRRTRIQWSGTSATSVLSIAMLAVAVMAGCSDGGNQGPARTITGSLVLDGSNTNTGVVHSYAEGGQEECVATGEYDDVKFKTPVTLRDAEGRLLGVSNLGMGFTPGSASCRFGWAFTDVPDSEFYTFEIGTSGRKLPFSRDQLTVGGSTGDIANIEFAL